MSEKNDTIQKIDSSVLAVIGDSTMQGFMKAELVAKAIIDLRALLTDTYMAPIMALQGTKLGFRTDKDRNKDGSKGPGYPMPIVRECLIEAVLIGLQPTGNQFNIIAGNMYPTKEGCGYLLNKVPSFEYEIIEGIPRVNPERTGAAVDVTIQWKKGGKDNKAIVPFPIKMDSYTSIDAVIGKAKRKARAWLLSRISGMEITDGDITDMEGVNTMRITGPAKIDKVEDRILQTIGACETTDELDAIRVSIPEAQMQLFNEKYEELHGKKGKGR